MSNTTWIPNHERNHTSLHRYGLNPLLPAGKVRRTPAQPQQIGMQTESCGENTADLVASQRIENVRPEYLQAVQRGSSADAFGCTSHKFISHRPQNVVAHEI